MHAGNIFLGKCRRITRAVNTAAVHRSRLTLVGQGAFVKGCCVTFAKNAMFVEHFVSNWLKTVCLSGILSCLLKTWGGPLFTDFGPKLIEQIYSGWIWSGFRTLFLGRLLEHAQSCHHKAIQIRCVQVPEGLENVLNRIENRSCFKILSMCCT